MLNRRVGRAISRQGEEVGHLLTCDKTFTLNQGRGRKIPGQIAELEHVKGTNCHNGLFFGWTDSVGSCRLAVRWWIGRQGIPYIISNSVQYRNKKTMYSRNVLVYSKLVKKYGNKSC